MKMLIIKGCLSFLLLSTLVAEADAQRAPRRRAAGQPQQAAPTQQGAEQQQSQQPAQPSGYNPYGNIPIEVDSTGVSDSVIRKSARPDNIYDTAFTRTGRVPLPYDHIR